MADGWRYWCILNARRLGAAGLLVGGLLGACAADQAGDGGRDRGSSPATEAGAGAGARDGESRGGLTGSGSGNAGPTGPRQTPGAPGEPAAELESDLRGVGTDQPFDLVDNPSDRVGLDGDGALIVDRQLGDATRYMWVADTNLPGVSKIDLETMQVVARYRAGAASTSRTTVNVRGEAFVGSRAGGGPAGAGFGGGVTKILPGDCPDQDGDGVVTTSTGPDDVLPWGQDECVAWFTPTPGDIRGLAAQDLSGIHAGACEGWDPEADEWGREPPRDEPDQHYVWVGGTHGKIYKLDAESGEILLTLSAPVAGTPYGLALGGDGKLWTAQQLGFVDTLRCVDQATCEAEPVCSASCSEANCSDACDDAIKARFQGVSGYGVTVDCKQRVWMTGTTRLDLSLPPGERLRRAPGTGGLSGIAADAQGFVWSGAGANLHRIDQESLDHVVVQAVAKGVAVDAAGRVLSVQNQRLDLIEPGVGLNDAAVTQRATQLPGFAYAYSDMTGVQTRLAANDPGWYRQRFEGCDQGETDWQSLEWEAELPEGSWAMLNVRAADSEEALQEAPWRTVACNGGDDGSAALRSANLLGLEGSLLEVEVRFARTDPAAGDRCAAGAGAAARVLSFGPVRGCDLEPPPVE